MILAPLAVCRKSGGGKYEKAAALSGHEMIVKALANDGAETVVSGGWDGRVVAWKVRYYTIYQWREKWQPWFVCLQVSGERIGVCELGGGNYVNALAVERGASRAVFAGGKDGILVKIQF